MDRISYISYFSSLFVDPSWRSAHVHIVQSGSEYQLTEFENSEVELIKFQISQLVICIYIVRALPSGTSTGWDPDYDRHVEYGTESKWGENGRDALIMLVHVVFAF